MASFNNKSSVAAVSSRKSGWDYFWREKRVEFQKGLPEGLGYDEAKKELKKRLKDAWNVLSGPEKNVYEARVSLNAPSVSNGAITSESQGQMNKITPRWVSGTWMNHTTAKMF